MFFWSSLKLKFYWIKKFLSKSETTPRPPPRPLGQLCTCAQRFSPRIPLHHHSHLSPAPWLTGGPSNQSGSSRNARWAGFVVEAETEKVCFCLNFCWKFDRKSVRRTGGEPGQNQRRTRGEPSQNRRRAGTEPKGPFLPPSSLHRPPRGMVRSRRRAPPDLLSVSKRVLVQDF